jgi:hypothetical protein
MFTIGGGPSTIVTAALSPRSFSWASERWIFERWGWWQTAVGFSFIECVVATMHLSEVMILEAVVERLEELVDGDHRLVGHVGEDERIGVVGHVSEPRRGAGFESQAVQTPADKAFHRVR